MMSRLPLALKQKAETAVPEAANAAWVDAIVAEATIQQVTPDQIHPLPDVLEGTTYTGEGAICLPEDLDMPFTEKRALALQPADDFLHPSKSQSQDDLSNHHQAVSNGGSSRLNTSRTGAGSSFAVSRAHSKRSIMTTARTVTSGAYSSHTDLLTVTERPLSEGGSADDLVLQQEQLPEPPSVAPVPEIGHVEGSVSGLVLSPVSVGNLHRPAAAARMLRNQSAGMPRVAT